MSSKEAVVIVLDIGRTMSQVRNNTAPLEGAAKAVNLLVQQKLLFGKNDEVGVVLLGTRETENALMEDGYSNITVLRDIAPPDLDLLRKLEKIEPEGQEGDLLDALIVALDLLMKRQQVDPKKKYQKRLFLVSDAGMPINKDDVAVVVDQFSRMDAKLNIIGIDFKEEEEESEQGGAVDCERNVSDVKMENEELLRDMAKQVGGVIVAVNQALDMMSYFRSKGVLQRSTFRGLLQIGRHLHIPVWSFIKTMEQKFPLLRKISTVAQEAANPGNMNVVLERSYHSITEPDVEIPTDERVKGYKYGKTLVPFSKIDESALKYSADACMKIIGFTQSHTVPRHHFMGNVECIVPNPSDQAAGTALSALIHALAETDSVAIIRYVKRNKSVPHLGVLSPHIKADYECLFYNALPFSEDIRQFSFASLAPERIRKSFVPTKEQNDATEQLIRSLDLTEAAEDEEGNRMEALKPKHTYNPVLQRFYQCVQHRALHPNTPLPKLDPLVERYVNPDEELFHKAAASIKNFQDEFPLMKSEDKKEKTERIYWKDSLANQIKLDSYVPDPSKKRKIEGEYGGLSLESLISSGVSKVGSIHPVDDFKEMLARRDVDLVDTAIQGLEKIITELVNNSVLDQLYPKALDCMIALRAGCVQEEEPAAYNSFLKELRGYYEGKRRDDFWQQIAKKGLTLIHNDESEDSVVTVEEAQEFFHSKKKDEPIVDLKPKKVDEDSVDDLLAMAE